MIDGRESTGGSVGFGAAATAELAAAVSNAGACGVLGTAGLSPNWVQRELQRLRKLTSRPFARIGSIDAARALLAARTAPIAEIAQLVGFRTPSHFTTTFRRVTGMTPSAYRSETGAASVGCPPPNP